MSGEKIRRGPVRRAQYRAAGARIGTSRRLVPRAHPELLAREGRSVAIRVAGRTVEATLVEGEPMEMRIAATTRKLTVGATLQVSL